MLQIQILQHHLQYLFLRQNEKNIKHIFGSTSFDKKRRKLVNYSLSIGRKTSGCLSFRSCDSQLPEDYDRLTVLP